MSNTMTGIWPSGKPKLWDGKDLSYYMEHGHTSTMRRPDKWYRSWEGKRLHFYIEMIVDERDKLRKNMEEAKVPFIDEWEWADYQPLPTAVLDPVHNEPAEFDLLAISFKDVQMNFGENLSIPWISDIVYNDPVHMGVLINPKTAAARNIGDGDIIRITSPYGNILGIAKVTEGVHLDCLAISNALTRWTGYHSIVKAGGGNFNRLLPANLKNTDANSGQMECTAKVKVNLFRKKPMNPKDAEQTLRKHTFSK